jgi:hypothetical protein
VNEITGQLVAANRQSNAYLHNKKKVFLTVNESWKHIII